MPLFDINEFGASDAQIGGFGFGSQPLKSTFINIDRQRQTSIAAAIEAQKAFCSRPKLLFLKRAILTVDKYNDRACVVRWTVEMES